MHICHVASALKGGSEIMLAQLVAAQHAAGHQISLVYSPSRDNLADFRHLFPKSVKFVPWPVEREITLTSDLRAFKSIHDILKRLNPAIVHLHNAKAGAHGRIACWILGIANIYTPHGLSFLRKDIGRLRRNLYFAAEWLLAFFGDRMVALSQGEYDAIRSIPCRKELIGNGLDVDAVRKAASARSGEGSKKGFRVVVSGRIEAQKDPLTVARIASLCPKDWEWIWIGEGSLRPVLESSGRFVITGWVSRETAMSLTRSADVFLQASLWEGMSFALLEAMALGRPCVVSNVVGNRDLIRHRVTGYVCDRLEEYPVVLERIVRHPDEAAQLGATALKYVADNFSLAAITRRWDGLYSETLNGRKAKTSLSIRRASSP
jgi:glycosyltransferase involved in cell wall biosynthesis